MIYGGRGYHLRELSLDVITISLKSLFVAAISWTLSTSAIKISLLLLYIRVFPGRPFRFTAYALMGMVAMYCIGSITFFLGICRPIESNWILNFQGATCGNQKAGWLGTGVANLLTDVAILSLPMRSVYHLQLPKRTKTAVAAIFGIGFLTVAVSIGRLVALLQNSIEDFTYVTVPSDILSAFEPTLMITCACMPIMRPLFRRLLPTTVRSKYGRGYGNDRTSMYLSNRMAKKAGGGGVQMKQMKAKEGSVKHKSITLPRSDGFETLSDLESKQSVSSSSGGPPSTNATVTSKEKFMNATSTIMKSRAASPGLLMRKELPQIPSPPQGGIEVTTEWTVEHE